MNADRNWKSYVREDNPDLSGFVPPPNPQDYDDILKFSFCTNVLVSDQDFSGGRENCVDAVRGAGYVLLNCILHCRGTAAVVFKGSIQGWSVHACHIEPAGATDIEVGQFDNYWYPFRAPTRKGFIVGTRTTNGAAVRCTCWNADKPEVDESVVVTKIPWVIWFPYFCFRFVWIRLFDGIPWIWKYDPPQAPTINGVPQ